MMVEVTDTALESARLVVERATSVLVLTGAGVSTASGIPDYRGPHGVWTLDPAAERASHSDVYKSEADVRIASWRRLLARSQNPPQPNAAHFSLAHFERTDRLALLATQNIDGLHQAAGSSPARVVEVHGHVRTVRCMTCRAELSTDVVLARVATGDADPQCGRLTDGMLCRGVLTTTIVRFGDEPDPLAMRAAMRAAEECDVMLCVGSTLSVFPVASLVPLALDCGARVIIVNDAPTNFDTEALCVRGDVTTVLPAILNP